MRLSIITPYYNTLSYTKKLAKVLGPQLNEEVEWIIVDDGCGEEELDSLPAKVIHLEENSGGASKPRNVGLDVATGEYIAFIDSDDMVAPNYIEVVLNSLKTDLIYISWKNKQCTIIMIDKPPTWNCSVWSRIYKRDIIGNVRFDEKLRIAEDYVFNKEINYKTVSCIKEPIYFYTIREGSLIRSVK